MFTFAHQRMGIKRRAIALDLPASGKADKPLGRLRAAGQAAALKLPHASSCAGAERKMPGFVMIGCEVMHKSLRGHRNPEGIRTIRRGLSPSDACFLFIP
jgi:hypothetical protein